MTITGQLPEHLHAYQVCRLMGWSYQEYLDAPIEVTEWFMAIAGVEQDVKGG